MRIAIATAQVPFIRGGAESMTKALMQALERFGHDVEIITLPFRFGPTDSVRKNMENWRAENLDMFDCGRIDKVISLKFPSFYLKHHNKIVWLMHQHRAAYELFDTPYGYSSSKKDEVKLRSEIVDGDIESLKEAKSVFTISRRVSERMYQYCGIESSPLYQPPPIASFLKSGDQLPYIFFPSRLESLKRQDLFVRAAKHLKSPVALLIAGNGGQREHLEALIKSENVTSRVRLVGAPSITELADYYSNALGVFFGPYDEDYGFVTLEAMLSCKPVITCSDSGGPLEFVINNETGYVVEPAPESIAGAIDRLYFDRVNARRMGQAGLEHFKCLEISWNNVVGRLLHEQDKGGN